MHQSNSAVYCGLFEVRDADIYDKTAPQLGKDSTPSFFSLQLVDLLHKLTGQILLISIFICLGIW